MYSVTLSGLHFTAPIGLYPEERTLKNDIEINTYLSREKDLREEPLLNYETLYQIISEEAGKEETLLENLLERIRKRIKADYPGTHLSIEIKKWHPPLGGRAEYASVKWEGDI